MKEIVSVILDHVNGRVPAQYEQVDATKREQAINKAFLDVLGMETYTKQGFLRAVRRNEARVYEIIEEIIQSGVQRAATLNPFFSRFVDFRNVAIGDSREFFVDSRVPLIVSEVARNHSIKKQRREPGTSYTLATKTFSIGIYEPLDRIASNRVTWAEGLKEVDLAVQDHIVELASSAFFQSLDQLPTEFIVRGSYSHEAITDLCETVSTVNNEKAIILGSKAALARLQGKTQIPYSDSRIDERHAKGFNTYFESYECVELPNYVKRGTIDLQLPSNKVFVVAGSDKPVKVTYEGEEVRREINQENQSTTRVQELSLFFNAGIGVVHGAAIGVIELA